MSVERARSAASELVPIADRLRYMQLFRAALATVVVVFGVLAEGTRPTVLACATAVYLLVSLLGELVWRGFRRRGLALFGAMLIVDGAFLAWVCWNTGDAASPLRFLTLVHLIAVSLLASYRTGLKLAMWHSLLLLLVFKLNHRVAAIEVLGARVPGTEFEHLLTFIGSFWLVAIATSSFSAVNERELRRRRYDLEALAQLAAKLEDATDPATVADVLVDRLAETFDFERALLLVARDEGLTLAAVAGVEAGWERGEPGPNSVVDLVRESRETLLVSGLHDMADRWLLDILPGAQNLLVVPLSAEGRAVAVLVAEHSMRSGSRIERRVVAAVERFASHGALSLRNAALLETMQQMAATDGLTMIANRRTFETTLEREISRAARTGHDLSLVMLDVDHFKLFNDTHGHQRGDTILRALAEILSDHCRDFDTAARYGGEEFALVLPECSAAESYMVAERVRRAFEVLGVDPQVTVSAGVATFPRHGSDADALVRAADGALYESKRQGRNRVTRTYGGSSATTLAPTTELPL